MQPLCRRAHEQLVDRLSARSTELADQLADAVALAAPELYRSRIDRGCRPLTHQLIDEALGCLRDGSPISSEALAAVDVGAHDNRDAGVPASVTIRAMGAALTCFVGAVRAEAETLPHPRAQVIAGIATLTARAPIVVFELMTAFIAADGQLPATAGDAVSRGPMHPTAAEVLRLTAAGLTAREVADAIGYTPANVAYHLARLRRRFDVSTTTALVVRAADHLPPSRPRWALPALLEETDERSSTAV